MRLPIYDLQITNYDLLIIYALRNFFESSTCADEFAGSVIMMTDLKKVSRSSNSRRSHRTPHIVNQFMDDGRCTLTQRRPIGASPCGQKLRFCPNCPTAVGSFVRCRKACRSVSRINNRTHLTSRVFPEIQLRISRA